MQNKKINKKKIGQMGESAAAVYLKGKGHIILGKNIRLKRGEIDILTRTDKTLHVVEVKTSTVLAGSQEGFILPEENFSRQKINRLRHLANVILAKYSNTINTLRNSSSGDIQANTQPDVQIDGVAIRIYQAKSRSVGHTPETLKITARYYPEIS